MRSRTLNVEELPVSVSLPTQNKPGPSVAHTKNMAGLLGSIERLDIPTPARGYSCKPHPQDVYGEAGTVETVKVLEREEPRVQLSRCLKDKRHTDVVLRL